MKKNNISSYCITLMIICQVFCVCTPVFAISEERKNVISERCEIIRDNLKDVQRSDSRVRIYLGRYYETILNKFMIPLNLRLVENNLSETDLIKNQNDFNEARTDFINNYVTYQKSLEELVMSDCKADPESFYNKLVDVRQKRATVNDEANKLRKLAGWQMSFAQALKEKI